MTDNAMAKRKRKKEKTKTNNDLQKSYTDK
jgi:hypothetical protein